MNKERLTLMLDKNLLEWIQKQVDNGEFDNQSAGIRRCILIARRVYEQANPEEKVKFILGSS